MTVGALILHRDGDDGEAGDGDLSVAAVLLDTIADAAAAAGVAVAGAIILAMGGWYWLDPAVALAIALVIAYHAIALIRKVLTRFRSAAADTKSCACALVSLGGAIPAFLSACPCLFASVQASVCAERGGGLHQACPF
jgi:Co/Zn/Cd efflux system component